MIDREKVIKAWECCNPFNQKCKECPYEKDCYHDGISRHMVADAIAMLKEQEAKPIDLYGKDDWYGLVCVCPDCKAEWMGDESNTHFCPNCGRAVKWE